MVNERAAVGQDDMPAIFKEMVGLMQHRSVDGLLSVQKLRNGRELWKHCWCGVYKYNTYFSRTPAATCNVAAPLPGVRLERCNLVLKTKFDF